MRLAPTRPTQTTSTSGLRLERIVGPELQVVAVDEKGLPIMSAQITVRGPGEDLEALGRGSWTELEEGQWTVEVSKEGFLTTVEEVDLLAGEKRQVLATLHRFVKVNGSVVDRFGAPLSNTRIWFLREGEEHPKRQMASRKLAYALTSPSGQFSVNLPDPGPFSLSVGGLGRVLIASEVPREFGPGQHEVDIVVPRGTRLEVQLADVPPEAVEKGKLSVLLYDKRRPGIVADPAKITRREKRERAVAQVTDPAASERLLKLSEGKKTEWSFRSSQAVPLDGHLVFEGLPTTREYRISIERGRHRFDAEDSFVLDTERVVVVHATVPLVSKGPGSEARSTPLAVHVQSTIPSGSRPSAWFLLALMAIVGLGIDIARIDRLEVAHERRGQRLLDRLFTSGEQAYCDRRAARFTHYAGRFAVKEAVMKVLGTGWRHGVRWIDIEVVREPGQAPEVVLHGASRSIAERRGIERIHIAITHDAGVASAVAIGERD